MRVAKSSVTYYAGSMVYKEAGGVTSIAYIAHSEGLAMKNGNSFEYQYNLTDHLGNVRTVLDAKRNVVQTNDYYPFGLTHSTPANLAKNKYLYNGKELQDDVIGGTLFGLLDYGFRGYDARIGRFTEPDPLQEKYHSFSPYVYCLNNPVRLIDPTGMSPENPVEGEQDEERNLWYSERFGWVSQQFYQFLAQGGYGFKDNTQGMHEFLRINGLNEDVEEIKEEEWGKPIGEPRDYYYDVAIKLIEPVGAILSVVPIIGNAYQYAGAEIGGLELFAGIAVDLYPSKLVKAAAKVGSMVDFFAKKKAKELGKSRANNPPDWYTREYPNGSELGENKISHIKRVLNNKYGLEKWNTGAGSEFSKIYKYLNRKNK